MRLLGIQNLPYQDLVIINSQYPALLTQRAHGEPVLRIWQNSKAFEKLDPFHTGLQIICAMLINPEDGKEDNFILSPDGRYLIPIDNDHCFLPSTFQKEGSFWNAFTVNTALQTKTILFCLDEMYMGIPLEVKKHIISIDFDYLLTSWMKELDKLEDRFKNLANQTQRKEFLEQGTVMRIPFYKQFIQNLHWKAHKIQALLKAESQLTPFDLLKAVEPFAFKCYQDSFKQGFNLQTRFKAATDNLYRKTAVDGSRMSILNTRTMMEIINVSEKDLQQEDQKMGPIDILELLNQLIQERKKRIGLERELLSEFDHSTQEKTWIRLFGNPPAETALKAFFANPKEGLILKASKLITSSKLMELFTSAPDAGMKIRFLSLPGSPVLTGKEIRILAEKCPNIEYLNVYNCVNLNQIYTVKGEWPLLARLEANDCVNLEKLVCYSPVKILKISTRRPIEIFLEKATLDSFMIKLANGFFFAFKKGGNLALTPLSTDGFLLDIFHQEAKLEKYLKEDKITLGGKLISSPKDLAVFVTEINFQDSFIKLPDVQKLAQLKMPNLAKLGLAKNEALSAGSLKYLIQGHWPKLAHLDLSENVINDKGFKVLARGNWPLLETLGLKLTEMTVNGVEEIVNGSKWPRLKHLDLCGNLNIKDEGLRILARGDWPLLETLDLSHVKITKKGLLSFILNNNTEGRWVNFQGVVTEWYGPHLKGHGFLKKKCPLLEILNLVDGEITQNEIEMIVKNRENWPKLKHLNLNWNLGVGDKALEILAAADFNEIEIIELSQTRVTKKGLLWFILNSGNWPKLKEIQFGRQGKNFAKDLLRKDWGKLEELDLSWDHIGRNEIEIMVKRCDWPVLRHLDLSRNRIGDDGFEILAEGNWPLLEILNLTMTEITTKGVEMIINKSKWAELKHLNLSKNEINDEAVAILCKGNWPMLEVLELEGTEVTRGILPSFLLHANWPNLKRITVPRYWDAADINLVEKFIQKDLCQVERLDLKNSNLGVERFEAILRKNYYQFGQLKYLNLSGNKGIFSGGKVSKIECPLLEELHLENTGINVEEIVSGSKWPLLKHLNISHNEILDEGVSLLVDSEWPLLENLNLSNTRLSMKSLEIIVNRSKWPQMLRHLDFSNNDISDKGLKLFTAERWPFIEELSLRNTKITSQGIETFANLPSLKKLDISENNILDEGLKILASQKWPLFEHLVYENTQVTSEGTLALLENSQWTRLNHLENSLSESFFATSQHEAILSIVPMSDKIVAVLNLNWLNSNEISLRLAGEKITLLPRDKWDQLESIKLSSHDSKIFKPTQSIIWPANLKALDLSNNPLELFHGKLPSLLENLCLQNTNLTPKYLIENSEWARLKKLNISQNPIQDE